MEDLKTYPEGTPFTGTIGRTAGESVAAWPMPPRARRARPTCSCSCWTTSASRSSAASARTSGRRRSTGSPPAGLRYRDFHTTAICSPTRACLLTGRNHHSNGVGIIQEMATGFPGYNGMVPRENGFLSEMLLAQGYATLAIGKWHLTLASEYASGASKARWPLSRGFERYYGFIGGKTNQWSPTLVHDSHYIDPPKTPRGGLPPQRRPGRPRDRVPDRPAHGGAAEAVLHVLLPRRRPCAAPRRARVDRALSRAVRSRAGTAGARRCSRASSRWASCRRGPGSRRGRSGSRRGTRCPPTRGGSMRGRWRCTPASSSRPTTTSGACIDFLARLGELDNTIVMLASDNGASRRGRRARLVQRAASSPTASSRPIEQNLAHLDEWGSVRSYPNYSWGWAWAGNTPLRRWKRYLHQGGMSDPLIVHWPRGIAARGEVRGQYVHVVDIAPTILEALGNRGAGGAERRRAAPARRRELRAHVQRRAPRRRRKAVQYYEMIGSRALWADGWKAVVEQPQGEPLTEEILARQKWELYHVASDFSECEDLADEAPGEARRAGRALVGRGRQSTTCCRSTRACSCAWASASPAPRRPATATCTTRAARRSSSTPRSTSRTARTPSPPRSRFPRPARRACCSRTAAGSPATRSTSRTGASLYVHNHLGLAEYRISSTEDLPAGHVDAALPLHAHRRAPRARRALPRRASDRRRRDPAHRAGGDRNLGRGPVLRLRQRPAGDAQITARRSASPGASRRWWSRSTTRRHPTRKRGCARP